jgi:hypothetical protein
MSTLLHAFEQGPMLRALGSVALTSLTHRTHAGARPETPGPWLQDDPQPPSASLVRDFVTNVGGDPAWYAGRVPAHLFPQWGFPLLVRALRELPYPQARSVNAGCRLEQRAPIPAYEPLVVRARLESIDDDGRRALVTQRLVTGTLTEPEAMTAEVRAYIPLGKGAPGTGKSRPKVPEGAEELAALSIDRSAGLEFAALTGDFNPIHWVRPYARAAGFRSTILHGFATFARTVEVLNRNVFGGDPSRLGFIDVRFTKPLVLPARVFVFATPERGVWVGDGPGGDAYLEGRFGAVGEPS